MAKHENQQSIHDERVDTVLYDANGKEMLRFGFAKRDYEEDGTIKTEQIAENIECGDGTITSTAALIRTPGALKICDICRSQSLGPLRSRRSRMVFSPTANMKTCASCRRNLCSRHAIASRVDGRHRCRACDRWASCKHILSRIARVLFFKEVQRPRL